MSLEMGAPRRLDKPLDPHQDETMPLHNMTLVFMLAHMTYRSHKPLTHKTYFFTAALSDRRSTQLTTHIDILREAFRYTKIRYPFLIEAMVVLPDHLHTIWTFPSEDTAHSHRWAMLQSRFARSLRLIGVKLPLLLNGEFNLWQQRYSVYAIRDEHDLAVHIDHIHLNPVKHGLVEDAKDWPYSSFHRYYRQGRRMRWPDTQANTQETINILF
jgi:putative transposase